MEYFWTNTIWYLLLGITTILEFTYVMLKAEKRRLMFALFLTISGMTFLFQLTIFGFLKSYDYYPMVLYHISSLDDELAGNLFSQFSVSATALLIVFLNLRYYWYIIIALLYGGIEELFLSLGIYSHNWYQTWMTVAALILLFSITKIMYHKIFMDRPGRILTYIFMYFAVFVPHTDLISWPFRLFAGPTWNANILPDPLTSAFLLFAINYNVLANITMITYYLKVKWWWHAIVISAFYLAYYLAYKFNYIIYKDIDIVMLFATVEIWGMYLFVYMIDRLYDQTE